METHSILRPIFCIAWIIAGFTFAPHPTVAEEANAPAQKTIGATKPEMVPSLIVMNLAMTISPMNRVPVSRKRPPPP